MKYDNEPYTFWENVGAWFGTIAITFTLLYLIVGCSTTPSYSQGAQAADLATTAVALAGDAVESNALLAGADPAGWVVIGVVKLALPVVASKLSPGGCKIAQTGLFGLGAGAAVNNIAVIAGAASGGMTLAIPLGIVAMFVYDRLGWSTHDCPQSEGDPQMVKI